MASADDEPSVFAAPREVSADGWQGLVVAGVWALAGGVVGAAAGLTLDVLGSEGLAVRATVIGCVAGALCGGLAWRLERAGAADRPDVADLRGSVERRAHAVLFLAPLAFVVVPLMWVAVLVTASASSLWPLIGMGLLVLGLAWPARRLTSRQALLRAVEALERGELTEARARLTRLARARWASAAARDTARLNLGMLSLRQGAVDQALDWLADVREPRVQPHVLATRAVALVVVDRREEAERAVREAIAGGGVAVAAEVDAARLLLVWRAEGPAAASELGERLGADHAGALFCGLLAALRLQSGDSAGAAELLGGGVREGLATWPLCRQLPELAGIFEPQAR